MSEAAAHDSLLTREAILRALEALLDANRIPLKTQYLIEGLFEEGEV